MKISISLEATIQYAITDYIKNHNISCDKCNLVVEEYGVRIYIYSEHMQTKELFYDFEKKEIEDLNYAEQLNYYESL